MGSKLLNGSTVELLLLISEGYHGSVFKGTYQMKPVAVKKLRENYKVNLLELELLQILTHRGIVQCFGWFQNVHMYYVMEWCLGNLTNFQLSHMEAARVSLQLISAVSYIHGLGYIHANINPKNCLLDERLNCKLTDFNAAFHLNANGDATSEPCFTTGILVSETNDGGVLRESFDVFAVGATIFYAFTHTQLFDYRSDDTDLIKNNQSLPKVHNDCSDEPNFRQRVSSYYEGLRQLGKVGNLIGKMINVDRNLRPSCLELLYNSCLYEIANLECDPDLIFSENQSPADYDYTNLDTGGIAQCKGSLTELPHYDTGLHQINLFEPTPTLSVNESNASYLQCIKPEIKTDMIAPRLEKYPLKDKSVLITGMEFELGEYKYSVSPIPTNTGLVEEKREQQCALLASPAISNNFHQIPDLMHLMPSSNVALIPKQAGQMECNVEKCCRFSLTTRSKTRTPVDVEKNRQLKLKSYIPSHLSCNRKVKSTLVTKSKLYSIESAHTFLYDPTHPSNVTRVEAERIIAEYDKDGKRLSLEEINLLKPKLKPWKLWPRIHKKNNPSCKNLAKNLKVLNEKRAMILKHHGILLRKPCTLNPLGKEVVGNPEKLARNQKAVERIKRDIKAGRIQGTPPPSSPNKYASKSFYGTSSWDYYDRRM